jgi:hypothetical protein
MPTAGLAELGELVDTLELGCDGGALVEAFAVRDRLDARLALAVASFAAEGLHERDGALSMSSWLQAHTDRDAATATRICSTGRKLRDLPVLRDAVLDGRLTGGQLDAVLTNVPLRHVERFAEHEAEVVPRLEGLDAERTRRAMQAWRRHADAVDEGSGPVEHDNELHLSRTIGGRGELRGSLDADTTAVLEAALRVADVKDYDLSLAQRRAWALGQVAQHFLDHQQTRTGGRHRPHVNVVVDYEAFCEGIGGRYLDTDQPVSPSALGVLACDSALHRLLVSGASGILDYGRATRAWPVDLYNAIALRDGGCRFPGCDAPPSWCDVHHATFWEHGGSTSLDNGVMGCRRHHHLVHQPGYHLKLLPDGTVEVTFPDGHLETSRPRGPNRDTLWRQPDVA